METTGTCRALAAAVGDALRVVEWGGELRLSKVRLDHDTVVTYCKLLCRR
jgi:hypothetical protein